MLATMSVGFKESMQLLRRPSYSRKHHASITGQEMGKIEGYAVARVPDLQPSTINSTSNIPATGKRHRSVMVFCSGGGSRRKQSLVGTGNPRPSAELETQATV
jgi:hypothetical protein